MTAPGGKLQENERIGQISQTVGEGCPTKEVEAEVVKGFSANHCESSSVSDSAISTTSQCTSCDVNSQTSFFSGDDDASASVSPEPSDGGSIVHTEAETGEPEQQVNVGTTLEDLPSEQTEEVAGSVQLLDKGEHGGETHQQRRQRMCSTNKRTNDPSAGQYIEQTSSMRMKPMTFYQDLPQTQYYNLMPNHVSTQHLDDTSNQATIYAAAVAPQMNHAHQAPQSHFAMNALQATYSYPHHPSPSLIYDQQTHQATSAPNFLHYSTDAHQIPQQPVYYNLQHPFSHPSQIYYQHRPQHTRPDQLKCQQTSQFEDDNQEHRGEKEKRSGKQCCCECQIDTNTTLDRDNEEISDIEKQQQQQAAEATLDVVEDATSTSDFLSATRPKPRREEQAKTEIELAGCSGDKDDDNDNVLKRRAETYQDSSLMKTPTGAAEAESNEYPPLTSAPKLTSASQASAAADINGDKCEEEGNVGVTSSKESSRATLSLNNVHVNECHATAAQDGTQQQALVRYKLFTQTASPYYHLHHQDHLPSHLYQHQVANNSTPPNYYLTPPTSTNHSQYQTHYSAFVAGRQLMPPGAAPFYGPRHQHFADHSTHPQFSTIHHQPPVIVLAHPFQHPVTYIQQTPDNGAQIHGATHTVVNQTVPAATPSQFLSPALCYHHHHHHQQAAAATNPTTLYQQRPVQATTSQAAGGGGTYYPMQLPYQYYLPSIPTAPSYNYPPTRLQMLAPTTVRSHCLHQTYDANNQPLYHQFSHDTSMLSAGFHPSRHAQLAAADQQFERYYYQPATSDHGARGMMSSTPMLAFNNQFKLAYSLLSMLPIDAQSARTRQAYGMDKVWQDEFESLFSQFSPSLVWTLTEAESNPSIRDSDSIIGYKGHYVVRADHSNCCSTDDLDEESCSRVSRNEQVDQVLSDEIDRNEESLEELDLSKSSRDDGIEVDCVKPKSSEVDSDCDSGAQVDLSTTDSGVSNATGSSISTNSGNSCATIEKGESSEDGSEQKEETQQVKAAEPVKQSTSPGGPKKFPTRFRMFIDSAKVRFCCDHCGHGWTSMKGRVVFWYELFELVDLAHLDSDQETSSETSGNMIGYCAYKLFGQQCDVCKIENRFERPMWYPEEVTKVLTNLYNKIGQIYFGFKMPAIDKQRRAGKPKTSHNSLLCQACHDGVCTDRR